MTHLFLFILPLRSVQVVARAPASMRLGTTPGRNLSQASTISNASASISGYSTMSSSAVNSFAGGGSYNNNNDQQDSTRFAAPSRIHNLSGARYVPRKHTTNDIGIATVGRVH